MSQQLSRAALLPGMRERLTEAQELLQELRGVTPPASLNALHRDAEAHAERFVDWLSLELEWGETGAEAARERANAMLPEIGARRTTLERGIVDVAISYSL